MAVRASRFTVTGMLEGITQATTRATASSAMVLADQMARKGYYDIRIVDRLGVTHERAGFRLTLPLVVRLGGSGQEA